MRQKETALRCYKDEWKKTTLDTTIGWMGKWVGRWEMMDAVPR